MISLRFLLPLLLLAIAAPPAAAAQLTFGGIPWGTPADSATAAIQRAGFVLRGEDQDGDRVFGDAEGVDLVTMFDSAGLVGVNLEWSRPVDALPGRAERSVGRGRGAVHGVAAGRR
ncbi:MAG TPA: hypothetical protein VEQ60_16490 [Longimicrobium sp.]|nr:hypothetical protein [Longimicrobium sp.]